MCSLPCVVQLEYVTTDKINAVKIFEDKIKEQ
jgi:hypothetical protein